MRRLTALLIIFGFMMVGFAFAQEKYEMKKCEQWIKLNNDTKKIIDGVLKRIEELEKELGKLPAQAAHDREDCMEWYKKAEEAMKKADKEIKANGCTKKAMKQLGWAWQWYIKAGTMAVNAKDRAEIELKRRKRKK